MPKAQIMRALMLKRLTTGSTVDIVRLLYCYMTPPVYDPTITENSRNDGPTYLTYRIVLSRPDRRATSGQTEPVRADQIALSIQF